MANKVSNSTNEKLMKNIEHLASDISKMDDLDQYIFVEENTDDVSAPEPGNGLYESRKNRVDAALAADEDLVTIVVQSFNRLDKSMKCIDSILKYTKDINYELILIDNGSTDDTLNYYKSVQHPRKTIVHVTKNIGSYVPPIYRVHGKFVAHICNDTYVTKDWLKNLLTCLKSDESIGLVVPVISNGSNNQGADISFTTLEEMQEKAAAHNVSNPALWHERIRLVIQMAIYRREVLDIVGYPDYGFFHDFADDDLSFRVRRAGYKIVLCRDTFVHHDHIRQNMTVEENEAFNRSIEAGRADFHNKYFGLDAWLDVNNYEPTLMALINPMDHNANDTISVLGVETACGTPILEIKNKLKENAIKPFLSAFTTDPKYWLDLKTICNQKVEVGTIENIGTNFIGENFDYIILGKYINSYANPYLVLEKLLSKLKANGHLLLNLRNSYDFTTLIKSVGGNVNMNAELADRYPVFQMAIDEFLIKLDQLGYRNNKIITENWPVNQNLMPLISNAIAALNLNTNSQEVLNRSIARKYSIDIVKK